jgi:putative ABC transport system permease protein
VILVVGGAGLAYGLLVRGPDSMAAVSLGALLCFLGLIVIAPFLARPVVGVLSLPFPYLSRASGRLARNNALREPRRTAATALALMIGLGLVAAIGTGCSTR